jgi:hypothetical protein
MFKYNVNKFYNVIINTKALTVLTIGFGQYLAY